MWRISVSDVAALVGRNPYRKRNVEIARWIRTNAKDNPTLLNEFMARESLTHTDLQTEAQKFYIALNKKAEENPALVKEIKEKSAAIAQTSDIAPLVEMARSAGIAPELADATLRMRVGTVRELDAQDVYLKFYGHGFEHHPSKLQKEIIPGKLVLSGIPDAIDPTDGQETLVEIKTRRHGLFHELREYERIQLQLYMWMTDMEQGGLLEMYMGTHDFHRDSFDADYVDTLLNQVRMTYYEINQPEQLSIAKILVKMEQVGASRNPVPVPDPVPVSVQNDDEPVPVPVQLPEVDFEPLPSITQVKAAYNLRPRVSKKI